MISNVIAQNLWAEEKGRLPSAPGAVTTLADSPLMGAWLDGTGSEARFTYPVGELPDERGPLARLRQAVFAAVMNRAFLRAKIASQAFATLLCFAAFTGPTAQAQDWAKEQLNKSPRHSEWVDLKHDGRTVKTFVVYPEVKSKAATVLVIHEIFGLTDWAKNLADELAAAGYIAIAPDLLSAPGKDTSSYPDQGAAIKAISALPDAQIFADLDAAADYAAKLPAANGALAVTGFCWGGGKAFGYANHNPKLKASYVFYGMGPEKAADATNIACPVYGFYGEDDARIGATIPLTKKVMQEANKTFEPVIYPRAGHGFMRAGEAPDASEANRSARDAAWERWKVLLKTLNG